jgi:hypothetical protein
MVHDERTPEELRERNTTSKRNYVSADRLRQHFVVEDQVTRPAVGGPGRRERFRHDVRVREHRRDHIRPAIAAWLTHYRVRAHDYGQTGIDHPRREDCGEGLPGARTRPVPDPPAGPHLRGDVSLH